MIPDRREPRPSTPGKPLKVLIVDDDRDSRLTLQHAVMAIGHRCAAASDGLEAWEMHAAHPADVIIADWVMPRFSGVELCRRVREAEGDAYTYFVLLSALSDKEHFLAGMSAGADDYLAKPVDLDELEARIAAAQRVMAHHKRLAARNMALRKDSEQNFHAARVDALTGIANRRQLDEDLAVIFATPYRLHHSAALADIDLFKAYNDRFEHQAGDEALRRVAGAMRSALRQGDFIYRYGGEEFLVILRDQRIAAAARAMERIRRAVQELGIPHPDGPAGVVTISVGVAELTPEVGTKEEWLHRADAALYRAKAAGRNRIILSDSRARSTEAAPGKPAPQ
jgi:diguanylate cyclase (GGDEF)-like protein